MIDPRNLRVNALAPAVHIEQVTADRRPYEAAPGLRLLPLVRDLAIDYQTRWFQALVVASTLGMFWVAYLVRVRQVALSYQRRLDERVNERTRIARELHDTLLQSFHGVLLRFQTASYLLPERPAEAKRDCVGVLPSGAR